MLDAFFAVDHTELGEKAMNLLLQWHELEPERCRKHFPFPTFPEFIVFQVKLRSGGFYEVSSSHPWFPSSVELALISRSVAESASDRGWISYAAPLNYPSSTETQLFEGKAYPDSDCVWLYACEIAEDEAIAHLAAYLKAINGEFQ